jgi:hypothetical protein
VRVSVGREVGAGPHAVRSTIMKGIISRILRKKCGLCGMMDFWRYLFNLDVCSGQSYPEQRLKDWDEVKIIPQ